MSAIASVAAITLDCPNPTSLADFYRQALEWELIWSDENSAYLSGDGGSVRIGFQRVDDFKAPEWPKQDVPQQMHIDLSVANLDEAEAALTKLGSTKPDSQPGGDRWRVLLDPVGHPFCITTAA